MTDWALKIEATGEVRDADGNLKEDAPIQWTLNIPEEELQGLLERLNKGELQ
jgi:hypothetical protein